MKLTGFFKWLLCASFVVYLILSAFFKIIDLFVPSFEMKVAPELAQVVKRYDGLLQVDVGFSTHDVSHQCDTDKLVVSLASEGFFSVLGSDIEYSCGNGYSEECPDMLIEYRDETTVYVSDMFTLRSFYPLSHVQECVLNAISLGRSLEKYVDIGMYNQRTYDVL